MRAWSELAYLKPPTEEQMDGYELLPAPGNPGRVARPSITARLKEASHITEPKRDQTRPNTTSPMRTDKEDTMDEKDNYLHTDKLSEEQNGNMLNGILNNLPPLPLPQGPIEEGAR